MTEEVTRHLEPICCFCGVKVGLRIAHFLSLLMVIGMSTIVSLLETEVMIVGMGIFFFLASIVGQSITFSKNAELVRLALYVYYTFYIIGLVLLYVIWIQIGEKEFERIAGLKAKNPSIPLSDIESLKKSISLTILYQTATPTIFFILVLNRSNAYRKWLQARNTLLKADSTTEMNPLGHRFKYTKVESMKEIELIALVDADGIE